MAKNVNTIALKDQLLADASAYVEGTGNVELRGSAVRADARAIFESFSEADKAKGIELIESVLSIVASGWLKASGNARPVNTKSDEYLKVWKPRYAKVRYLATAAAFGINETLPKEAAQVVKFSLGEIDGKASHSMVDKPTGEKAAITPTVIINALASLEATPENHARVMQMVRVWANHEGDEKALRGMLRIWAVASAGALPPV